VSSIELVLILASCGGERRKSVLEELRVKRLAVIQEDIGLSVGKNAEAE